MLHRTFNEVENLTAQQDGMYTMYGSPFPPQNRGKKKVIATSIQNYDFFLELCDTDSQL